MAYKLLCYYEDQSASYANTSSSSDNQFEVVAYVCFTIIFFKISSTLYEQVVFGSKLNKTFFERLQLTLNSNSTIIIILCHFKVL